MAYSMYINMPGFAWNVSVFITCLYKNWRSHITLIALANTWLNKPSLIKQNTVTNVNIVKPLLFPSQMLSKSLLSLLSLVVLLADSSSAPVSHDVDDWFDHGVIFVLLSLSLRLSSSLNGL